MKQLEFSIEINASKEKVWFTLWDDDTYREWTTAFCEGSYAISNWEEGTKIFFLDPKHNGMSSLIHENKPFDRMVFKHITEIYGMKESPIDEKIATWTGAKESYFLTENNQITTLKVVNETVEAFEDFFQNTMPNALAKVKEIAEIPTKNITVRASVNAPLQKVWDYFTQPEHIVNWNFASDDWYCPKSENEVEVGKRFTATMASKNGEHSFDFGGTYTEVIPLEKISYSIDGDGRKVSLLFHVFDNKTLVTEIFEPENENSIELQRAGWQAILTNFKNYTENQ